MMRTLSAITAAWAVGLTLACTSFSVTAQSEDALLEKVRTGQVGNRADEARQMASFRRLSDADKRARLSEARARRDTLQAQSTGLEKTARDNKLTYERKINELRSEMGPNAALFGLLQQNAADLVGILRNSPTSLDYPGREAWLAELIARMEKASEIFTIEDLEKLWFLIQQEITASGQIVNVDGEVITASGDRKTLTMTRVGKFNLVASQPEAAYLTWQADNQRASLLKRQPEGRYLDEVSAYRANTSGVAALGIDPTGGSLLSRLVDAPSLLDRVHQGGLIGYLIIALGAVGVLIAIFKLASILIVGSNVAAQRRNIENPRDNNPLGRMLLVYEANQDADTETLEMRLGEAILEERPKLDRYISAVKVISALAPLMGLMGTVIGMIATFQAITLFGTGDPKTMAGGISQALVTTVLGLTVAIPTVLLHAIVSARATAVINTLKHQTAGLIAERMESRAA
ncbi:MAG: energy transducer TonB [Oceanococcus sp.]|nr:MAG: energy transducer TonB [Oceanococcus sp.]